MAVWSEHPMVERHAYLPLVFVAMVYGYPAVIWIRAKVTEVFFRTVNTEEVFQGPQTTDQTHVPDRDD